MEPISANVQLPTTTVQTTPSIISSTFSWISESDYDCNFENSLLCSWEDDPTSDFTWKIMRNSQFIITGN